ncbi:hypothetical protein CEY00_Acc21756 [Actinidia chinensis var. chinensis]|uniref:RING-type domain-containing protein n=1 Tax=Actinidia chinensis var. chinensis TaxID=1590841 RepID=A0A2R6P2Y2_ACTCC|nr:hypothetical protein CEY00_Acc21756 [Actinidia chinensis var. chinensis]
MSSNEKIRVCDIESFFFVVVMGYKFGRTRQVVEEKYTRPQGLYEQKDVDHKKLKKFILDCKLAPCYPGEEECCYDLEEFPICFLYYPSLNRSRCCMKGICTECFLQMKNPSSTCPTQCPFCKTSNYAVEYRGVKTKEEKGMEQLEEQRVIEAKIRKQQQKIQDEEERVLKRQEISSSTRTIEPGEVGYGTLAGEEITSSPEPFSSMRQAPCPGQSRDDEFDWDLEDIMVMEAIWLSIQENSKQRNPTCVDPVPSEQYMTEDRSVSPTMPPLTESASSTSGGLACAIANLAERQQMSRESSGNNNGNMTIPPNTFPSCSRFPNRAEQETECYLPPGSRLAMTRDEREWGIDHGSEVSEAGTSCANSEAGGGVVASPPQQGIEGGNFQDPLVPESFEEQMMLAMAVSLADTQCHDKCPMTSTAFSFTEMVPPSPSPYRYVQRHEMVW